MSVLSLQEEINLTFCCEVLFVSISYARQLTIYIAQGKWALTDILISLLLAVGAASVGNVVYAENVYHKWFIRYLWLLDYGAEDCIRTTWILVGFGIDLPLQRAWLSDICTSWTSLSCNECLSPMAITGIIVIRLDGSLTSRFTPLL